MGTRVCERENVGGCGEIGVRANEGVCERLCVFERDDHFFKANVFCFFTLLPAVSEHPFPLSVSLITTDF